MEWARFEVVAWITHFAKFIPGRAGCRIRNVVLPYRSGTDVTVWELVHIDVPSRLVMGDRVSINRYSVLNATGGIEIGDNTIIGPGTVIYSQNHRFDDPSKPIRDQGYDRKATIIGRDVWIGAHAIVLPGRTIGDNAVVGAGSVVAHDVEPCSVVVGNPARKINERAASGGSVV